MIAWLFCWYLAEVLSPSWQFKATGTKLHYKYTHASWQVDNQQFEHEVQSIHLV